MNHSPYLIASTLAHAGAGIAFASMVALMTGGLPGPGFESPAGAQEGIEVTQELSLRLPPEPLKGVCGDLSFTTSDPIKVVVQNGLRWLSDHQNEDGYWDSDGFMLQDQFPDQPASDGLGHPSNDIGVTGLATLAFLGDGHSINKGAHSKKVRKSIGWFRSVQNMKTGLYGEDVGASTLYNHSIAATAMGEAYYFNKSPILIRNVRKSTQLILNSQNPYNAWGYNLEPNGDNNSSTTGWMVFALLTAEDGGVPVPKAAYMGAESWFKTMTDVKSGRTGYSFGSGGGPGGQSSRLKKYLERFPPEKAEALTALSLLCRIFMTDSDEVNSFEEHKDYELLKKQADLVLNKPPVWDEKGSSCDMYYWYYGTYAMNQWGGQHWKTWKKAMEKALIPNQRLDEGNFKGSWDPIGPWGKNGGRVYSTALCTLIMEVNFRYARVMGAR